MDAPRTDDRAVVNDTWMQCFFPRRSHPVLDECCHFPRPLFLQFFQFFFFSLSCFHRPAPKSEADALPCLFLITKSTNCASLRSFPRPFLQHSRVPTSPVTIPYWKPCWAISSPCWQHLLLSPSSHSIPQTRSQSFSDLESPWCHAVLLPA